MEVMNTPFMEGYKHVLVLKHSDAKKVWAHEQKTKCVKEVLKCMKDFITPRNTPEMNFLFERTDKTIEEMSLPSCSTKQQRR